MNKKSFTSTSGTHYTVTPGPRFDQFTVGDGDWMAVLDDDTPGHRDTFRWRGFHTESDAAEFLKTSTRGLASNPSRSVVNTKGVS